MLKYYLRKLLTANRNFLLEQAVAMKGFMQVLMKVRNTGEPWTSEEVQEIKRHLKTLSLSVPAIIVFLLPGGAIFFPLLAEVLDRRKKKR